ncbi:MAG: hypothetical protein J2P37_13090, partial [Ktedonobacteraceae bacterium]|nr:hypothetical protein [Ktedonobacteraceae bacterium]
GRFPLMSLLKHDSFGATPCLVKGRAVPTMGKPQFLGDLSSYLSTKRFIRQLERFGHQVILQPLAQIG